MLNKIFCLDDKQKINWSTEIIGGIINFMAISYIIIVNPLILNANGAGFPIAASITATVLIIVIMTLITSFFIKLPFALAPGMGINAIVSYGLILHDKLNIPTILGVIVFSSILLFLFSVFKIRELIVLAIPEFLQIALSIGIGSFLLLIGLKNAGIIISNPHTIIGIGHFDLPILLCCAGFIVATILFIKQKSYAFLLPIFLVTILYIIIYKVTLPAKLIRRPDFSLFMQIAWKNSLKLSVLPAILSLFIVNFFDATSSAMGFLPQLNLSEPKLKAKCLKRMLITDSVGGIIAGVVGTSPSTIFMESLAASQMGAKTGIAALVTALICLPFIFLSPLIELVPNVATSPILIVVGLIMINNIRYIQVEAFEDVVAAILAVIMMPLCFSITAGAVFGILSYTVLKILLGKIREVSVTLIIISIICCGWFLLN